MKRKNAIRYILLGVITTLSATMAFTATLSWFLSPGGRSDVIEGQVGLRNYYYAGNGSIAHPYEIVYPQHLYNLSRLQNLGMYPRKHHWQIGHYFSSWPGKDDFVPGYYCIDNGEPVKYLDMSSLASGRTLRPIGGEGVPFYGEFIGNDMPIKNLHVEGYPEDIGMFGYIASEGYVHNLILDNPEIVSIGYNPDTSADDNILFRSDVENFSTAEVDLAFDNAHYFAQMASLNLVDDTGRIESLKKNTGFTFRNGVNATSKLEAANDSQAEPSQYTKYAKEWFYATFDKKTDDPFTYEWHSSNYSSDMNKGLLNKELRDVTGDGDPEEVMSIDFDVLRRSKEFNSGGLMEAQTRIYLTASRKINNVDFTRVIQSYTIQFFSNGSSWTDESSGGYSMKIFCDYIRSGGVEAQSPSYFHRNNIGFLAGHCDGTMDSSYVLGGKFQFNGTDNVAIKTETETGLIGEFGKNVSNVISPEFGLTEHGDTGVMNFTRIYSLIRDDFEESDVTAAGRMLDSANQSKYFISYGSSGGASTGNHLKSGESFERYKEYLRHDEANPVRYIASVNGSDNKDNVLGIPNGNGSEYTIPANYPECFNSVDFLWNKVIEDDKGNGIDRGLGVFKIVTANNSNAPTGISAKKKVENEAAVLALDKSGFHNGDIVITNNGKSYTFDGIGWGTPANVANNARYVVDEDGQCYKWNNSTKKWSVINYGDYWRDNLGDSRIINGKKTFSKVYFSTAECDWNANSVGWGSDGVRPSRVSTLPSYPYAPEPPDDPEEPIIPIDPKSFDYPFSRDFNYVFEMDIGDPDKPEGQNYLFNTDSPFLMSYLYSILVDKYNQPILPRTARFGFMFRDSLNQAVTSLSSYMPIKKINNSKSAYNTKDGVRYYPSNCIVFHVDTAWANISVIGNGADIGIYHFDSTVSTKDIDEWYTMRSRKMDALDTHRYFKYDVETGGTETTIHPFGSGEDETPDMRDGGALYGHIFKVPRGDYVIGSSRKSDGNPDQANLYFLAVQGQSDAELGTTDLITVGGRALNVDFLLSNAGLYPFDVTALQPAYFAFEAFFDTGVGTLEVTKEGDYINVLLGSSATKAIGYCRKTSDPKHYLNGIAYTKNTSIWEPPP